jgi:hypothetical protein
LVVSDDKPKTGQGNNNSAYFSSLLSTGSFGGMSISSSAINSSETITALPTNLFPTDYDYSFFADIGFAQGFGK